MQNAHNLALAAAEDGTITYAQCWGWGLGESNRFWGSEYFDLANQFDHVIWAGDLNYRQECREWSALPNCTLVL